MDYIVKNIANKITNKKASVCVPGSKSMTARALLLATLAKGKSVVKNINLSGDGATFLQCVQNLGVAVELDGTTVTVQGCGGVLPVKKASLNVGSAGTAARFLTALLAFSEGEFTLDCSPQMKKRPMQPLLQALTQAGAKFIYHESEYAFPFTVIGCKTPVANLQVDVQKSSQYLSALMMCAPMTGTKMTLTPVGNHGMDYVAMTAQMMRDFGAEVEGFTVSGAYRGRAYTVEPDLSAACYFIALNKILGTQVQVLSLPENTLQGDGAFMRALQGFDGGKIDLSACSDQTLTLAAIAPYLSKPTHICGVAHIRGQECDRIYAIVHNLTALGVPVEELEDGVIITPSQPRACKIDTFGDHRVAMSFALTGLRADGVVIENAHVCEKTFANYFTVLDGVIEDLTK